MLIIIPTYNESENIYQFLQFIYDSCKSIDFSVLVVDDNSPDGTSEIVEKWRSEYSNCFLLKRKEKEGLGKAYVAGFVWGLARDFDYFLEIDADFSHKPEYIPELLKKLDDYDFVIGSRYIKGGGVSGWSIFRQIISRLGSLYARLLLNVNVKDFTGGFNLWKRKVIEGIDLNSLYSSGYSFQIEMKYRAIKKGFKFIEYPIIFVERANGKSKMSKNIIFEAMINVLKLRFKKID